MQVVGILLSVLFLAVWIVASGLNTRASIDLRAPGKHDDNLKKAYKASLASALFTWLLIAVVIMKKRQ